MRFWVSFWVHRRDLESMKADVHWPWWISGVDAGGRRSVCVAVEYMTPEHAQVELERAFKVDEWRFVEPRAADWSPFSRRFLRADWMKWPDGSVGKSDA